MGIFGALGKMAGSKVIEKVEDELTKKQNREQTSGYCNYIKNNMARICGLIAELESETRTLVDKVNASKGLKLSFKEKGEYRKTKEKAEKSLTYMYLARDFFTALAKNASGLILKNEELMLVIKFAPYFDGVPVLDIDDDEDSDDSVLGAFKEVGQELKEAFISSKKDSKHFDFDEYMKERGYEIKVGKHIAFKKKEQKKFIRLRSLGEGYSEDEIRLSISERKVRNSKSNQIQTDKTSLLIDVQKKLDEGKGQGYVNWAKVFNLKQMAKTVMFLQENDFENLEKLSDDISALSQKIPDMKSEIKDLESRLTELSTLKTQIINYAKTREVFEQYKASGYSKTFFAEHEGEIILHRAAKKTFDELGVKKLPSVKSINKEFDEVLRKKKVLYSQYHSSKERYREMLKHRANIQSILSITVPEKDNKKEQEQSH